MPGSQLRFERSYDFAREIVWDALVDSDLVSGWLAEADIEPRLHGRYDLDWLHLAIVGSTVGEIAEFDEPRLLVVDTNSMGVASFELAAVGPRQTSVSITVDALADLQFTPMISATWRLSLEQLGELLQGHPVDWKRWETERSARWLELLALEQQRI